MSGSGHAASRHAVSRRSVRVLKPTLVVLLLGLLVSVLTACGQEPEGGTNSSAPPAESQSSLPAPATTSASSPGASGGTGTEGSTGQGASAAKGAISAKQAMDLLLPKAKEWAEDALPVSLGAEPRGKTIEGGLCNYWQATMYSPSLRTAYIFYYFQDEYTPKPEVKRAAKPWLEGAEWQVGDLLGAWKIDSPELAKIVSERGVTEMASLGLSLREYRSDLNPPAEVPETCQVYWLLETTDGQKIYVDASTGEILE